MRCARNIAAVFALSLLHGSGALAQDTNTGASLPPLGKARPLQLPSVVEQTLPNGLKVVILEDHTQPALWLRLATPAGTIRDPHDKVGLVTMLAELLNKGTSTRSEDQIANTIDGLGASLGAGASEDYLTISANGLSVYPDMLFDLSSDIALHPVFPQPAIDLVRTQTLSSIQASLARGGTLADAALDRLIFGMHPYGNFVEGTPTTLPTITKEDLVRLHDTYFIPNGSTLFIAGDITPDKAMEQTRRVFGNWTSHELPVAPELPAPTASGKVPRILLIDRPGAAQTEIRIGIRTPGYSDPNRIIGTVATSVLGLGQFEGRLTKEIRVKRGLTYGASSFFVRNVSAGKFEIQTFTKNASTGEVVQLALSEAHKLAEETTPPDELQARKDFLIGSFAVGVATTPEVLGRLQSAILYGKGPQDLVAYTARVQAVTPDQIQSEVKGLGIQASLIVLVGDASAIEAQVKSLGDVTKIEASDLDLQSPTLVGDKTAAAAQAGTSATDAEKAEGKARIRSALKAQGGDAFLNLKSIHLKGRGQLSPPGQADAQFPVDSISLVAVIPDKARLDASTSFGDIIFAKGSKSGGWSSILGDVQEVPNAESFDPTYLLRHAIHNNDAVVSLPDANGGKLHGLAITDDQGKVHKIYLDAQTNLIRRIDIRLLGGDAMLLLSDYHAQEGVQLPGTMQIVQGGKSLLSITFTTFELNPSVDDKLFDRPK